MYEKSIELQQQNPHSKNYINLKVPLPKIEVLFNEIYLNDVSPEVTQKNYTQTQNISSSHGYLSKKKKQRKRQKRKNSLTDTGKPGDSDGD
ncbi:UNKNOWN [Stylonychia lemnae]|uniref:Uncharacterized protein n=1 Tax=Stylonychia lemnae TaxID=5949 RepID=A0A077ZPD5_STYLE|nr:UNKNOWN [Stylonychia lemnae]|eukprot:CDW71807.1 UNKNOWN [Stylonychia lemnae]